MSLGVASACSGGSGDAPLAGVTMPASTASVSTMPAPTTASTTLPSTTLPPTTVAAEPVVMTARVAEQVIAEWLEAGALLDEARRAPLDQAAVAAALDARVAEEREFWAFTFGDVLSGVAAFERLPGVEQVRVVESDPAFTDSSGTTVEFVACEVSPWTMRFVDQAEVDESALGDGPPVRWNVRMLLSDGRWKVWQEVPIGFVGPDGTVAPVAPVDLDAPCPEP
jgi:hypothetical protein